MAQSIDVNESPWSGFPAIETHNLRLRQFHLADIAPLVAIANAHCVADTAIDWPQHFTAAAARRWIEVQAASSAISGSLHWAITLKCEQRLIGYIGLQDIQWRDRQLDLRYWMGPGLNRGRHAVEAIQAAVDFAFTALDMSCIYATYLTRDALSDRIFRCTGMREQARAGCRADSAKYVEPVTVRGMTKPEWIEARDGMPTRLYPRQGDMEQNRGVAASRLSAF